MKKKIRTNWSDRGRQRVEQRGRSSGRVTEVSTKQLRKAIRNLHGCDSTWTGAVRVKETFEGETVWEGLVQVFNLIDHPKAKRCYAWSQVIDNSTKRRFVAVLHQEPVTSAGAAVRASIIQQSRE